MSFGIGLGAFVDGMSRGMEMRERMDARNERRANKKALTQIDNDAKMAFDEGVKSGEQQPDDYENFWKTYAMPKRRLELMKQGDYEGARALEAWSESDAAKKGGKLFASSLLKAQMGDPGGALDDAIEAGKVNGYLDHGYELKSNEKIMDADGNLLGYRLTVTDGEGKEFQQDVAPADVGRVVSTFINPEAAFQSQMDAKAKKATKDEEEATRQTKRGEDIEDYKVKKEIDGASKDNELDTYEAKKKIDKQYKETDPADDYSKALKVRMETDLKFPGKSPEEQDAIIRQDLEAAKAYANGAQSPTAAAAPGLGKPPAPAAPAPAGSAPAPAAAAPVQSSGGGARMVIDTATGQPIQMPSRAAPGLGGTPAPKAAPSTAPAPPVRQQALDTAVVRLAKGEDSAKIKQELAQIGVSEDELIAAVKGKAKPLVPQAQ